MATKDGAIVATHTRTHRSAHGQLLLGEQPAGSADSDRRTAWGCGLGHSRCEEDRSCTGRTRATRGRPRRSSQAACRCRELWRRHHAHAWRRACRFRLAPGFTLQPELRLQPLHVLFARLLLRSWSRSSDRGRSRDRSRNRSSCGRLGSRWGCGRLVIPLPRCVIGRRRCCAGLLIADTCRVHGLRRGLHRRLRGSLHRCQPPRHGSHRCWLRRIRLLRAVSCCWFR